MRHIYNSRTGVCVLFFLCVPVCNVLKREILKPSEFITSTLFGPKHTVSGAYRIARVNSRRWILFLLVSWFQTTWLFLTTNGLWNHASWFGIWNILHYWKILPINRLKLTRIFLYCSFNWVSIMRKCRAHKKNSDRSCWWFNRRVKLFNNHFQSLWTKFFSYALYK